MMKLTASFASYLDSTEFAAFECWNGDPREPWAQEAENYIRGWALRDDVHCLSFRNEASKLVAVTAFYRRTVGIPLLKPTVYPAWHLQVMGIALDVQGQGFAKRILNQTVEAMKELDSTIFFVTAFAEKRNERSLRACASIGLHAYYMKDEYYWVMLGELS